MNRTQLDQIAEEVRERARIFPATTTEAQIQEAIRDLCFRHGVEQAIKAQYLCDVDPAKVQPAPAGPVVTHFAQRPPDTPEKKYGWVYLGGPTITNDRRKVGERREGLEWTRTHEHGTSRYWWRPAALDGGVEGHDRRSGHDRRKG